MKSMIKDAMVRKNQVGHVRAERDVLAVADNPWIVTLHYSFQDEQVQRGEGREGGRKGGRKGRGPAAFELARRPSLGGVGWTLDCRVALLHYSFRYGQPYFHLSI